MPHHQSRLTTTGGLVLSTHEWLPDERSPRALVVLVHGYGEHVGRYAHVVAALLAHGYAVAALDHRGHGASAGPRALVRRFDDFVDDLHLLIERAVAAHPALPCFLLGHSMGGLIAVRYALAYQTDLAGMVLSGGALRVDEGVSPLAKRLGILVARLAPALPIIPSRPGVLSRDPDVDRRVAADPLNHRGRTKAGMAAQIVRAGEDARARLDRLTLPMLIMHGAADTVTNPSGSILLHDRATSPDKTLVLWPDHLHEIFNEPGRDAVIARALDWLDARVPAPPDAQRDDLSPLTVESPPLPLSPPPNIR